MGIIWKGILFLVRRGPEIYATGKMLHRSIGSGPALPPGEGFAADSEESRIEAVEREMDRLREEARHLSREVERISNDAATLRGELERSRRTVGVLLFLFAAFVVSGLLLGAAILSRFP